MRPAFQAKGRLKPGEMNKTEALYDQVLQARMRAGEILWYRFEAIKLRLGDNTFYNPDFAVLHSDFTLELHEVKVLWANKGRAGFTDDGRVKLKVAIDNFPIRFVLAIYDRKLGWKFEQF